MPRPVRTTPRSFPSATPRTRTRSGSRTALLPFAAVLTAACFLSGAPVAVAGVPAGPSADAVAAAGVVSVLPAALAEGDSAAAGEQLPAGAWLMSPSRTHGFTMQADGDLVAYGPRSRVLWRSGTGGHPGAGLVLQADGNLVITDTGGGVLWHAGTYGNPGAELRVQDDGNVVLRRTDGSVAWYTGWDRTSLAPGDALAAGQQVTSANGLYQLVLQPDGNLVTYAPGGRPVFYSGSWGAASVQLQPDGNLVARTAGGAAVWSSGTWRDGAGRLAVQDDGNVVLYRGDGTAAWYSGWDTGARAAGASTGIPLARPVQAPVPAPVPRPAPTTAAPTPAAPTSSFYANCDAVRAAGRAPLRRGEPGYRSALDRDADGVACE